MYNFDDEYQYTAYWFLLYEMAIIMYLSSAIDDFYSFYDGAVDIQIWWQEFNVESLILRWPLRQMGHLASCLFTSLLYDGILFFFLFDK